MARHSRIARESTRSLEKQAPTSAMSLPHIEELLAYGQITVGVLSPVGSVAIASDGRHTLAMLARRKEETLEALLTRLDQAIDKAINEEVFIDEINPR